MTEKKVPADFPLTEVEYLLIHGLSFSLWEVLVGLDEADKESDWRLWPSAATVARYCARTQRGAIRGLLALRARGLAMDLPNQAGPGSIDRWSMTDEGRAVLCRGPLFECDHTWATNVVDGTIICTRCKALR